MDFSISAPKNTIHTAEPVEVEVEAEATLAEASKAEAEATLAEARCKAGGDARRHRDGGEQQLESANTPSSMWNRPPVPS
jgi:hypothetical protein